jgi:hypothetical protein
MQKQSERAKPVAAQLNEFEQMTGINNNGLEFEKISQRIDFFDFEKNRVFTGVLLSVVQPHEFKTPVYLFSEYETHELFFVPTWHSLEKLKECEALGETVYQIVHNGVRQIGNNQTYHRCNLYKAKQLVPSRLDEMPEL